MSVTQERLSSAAMEEKLRRVARQLSTKYADRADPGEIERQVFDEAAQYRTAKVTMYVPVLVQHAAQERLRSRLRRNARVLAG